MIPTELLIKIGENQKINSEQRLILSKLDKINRQSNKVWNSEIADLDDETLVKLFKGIVFTEKELKWVGGSVAGGIWIYREIIRRKIDKNYCIANWTLSITENSYLPFGSTNYDARNIVEYFDRKWSIYHRREIEKISKEINTLNDNKHGLQNTINGLKKKIEVLKYRNLLLSKTNIEIASIIILDDKRPIYFYFAEIERILNDKSINKEILEQILKKFKEKEKRNTKQLKSRIEERINNYS